MANSLRQKVCVRSGLGDRTGAGLATYSFRAKSTFNKGLCPKNDKSRLLRVLPIKPAQDKAFSQKLI